MHLFRSVILLLPILAVVALAKKLHPASQAVIAPHTDIRMDYLPACQREAMNPHGHKQDYRGLTPAKLCRKMKPYNFILDTKDINWSCNISSKEMGEEYAQRTRKWWHATCGTPAPEKWGFCAGWISHKFLCRDDPVPIMRPGSGPYAYHGPPPKPGEEESTCPLC